MAITAVRRSVIFGQPGKVDKVGYVTPWGLKVTIHPLILEVFTAACEEAYRLPWKPQRIDSYNPRPIRGEDGDRPDEWSLHAWALAFDFFATPPNVPPPGGVWTPDNPVPADFAACFTKRGFRWGATFKRKDTPHIEWPDGLPDTVKPPQPEVPAIEEDPFMALTADEQKEMLAAERQSVWKPGTPAGEQHRLYDLVLWTLEQVTALREEVAQLKAKG